MKGDMQKWIDQHANRLEALRAALNRDEAADVDVTDPKPLDDAEALCANMLDDVLDIWEEQYEEYYDEALEEQQAGDAEDEEKRRRVDDVPGGAPGGTTSGDEPAGQGESV